MIPTTDLEMSRKLEKIIKKESLFIHYPGWQYPIFRGHTTVCDERILAPAYTTDEILDVLPDIVLGGRLRLEKVIRGYAVGYNTEEQYAEFCGLILPSALGSLLLWCSENGYLEGNGK